MDNPQAMAMASESPHLCVPQGLLPIVFHPCLAPGESASPFSLSPTYINDPDPLHSVLNNRCAIPEIHLLSSSIAYGVLREKKG